MKRAALLGLWLALSPGAARAQDPDDAPDADSVDGPEAATDAGKANPFVDGFRQGQAAAARKHRHSGTSDELTDDQAAALGLFSMCCCLVFLVGLIVLVVVLVKRARPAQPQTPNMMPPAAPFAPPGGTHLSVLAVAFDARHRATLEAALRSAGVNAAPEMPVERLALVRALCGALVEVSSNWRAFGYGDKGDFANDAAAETSFRAAWSDFRGRCLEAGQPDGEVCVAVLVLCTRGAVLGTSRLDDLKQARAVVQHRMGLAPEAVLGAACFFAPLDGASGAIALGDAFRRFPEMQLLVPG